MRIRKLYNNRFLRAHTQNIAKKYREKRNNGNKRLQLRCNRHLLHRRGWIDLFNEKCNITWEYCTGLALGIRFALDPSEEQAHFSIGLLFVTLYLSVNGLVPQIYFPVGHEEKQLVFEFHDNALWIKLWTPTNSWCKGQRSYSIQFDDIFLGKTEHKKTILSNQEGRLELPEASYAITYELGVQTWKRSRWFTKAANYVKAECKEGIPVPGKGEDSWNCGDQLLYSTSGEGKDVNVGRQALYDAVKRTRDMYGDGINMYVKNNK